VVVESVFVVVGVVEIAGGGLVVVLVGFVLFSVVVLVHGGVTNLVFVDLRFFL
jgi:hypothetical protein